MLLLPPTGYFLFSILNIKIKNLPTSHLSLEIKEPKVGNILVFYKENDKWTKQYAKND
jgi:hypothetical protein